MPATVTEIIRELILPGGPLRYTLRRNPRARTFRVTIHPARGVVVSVPPATRRGWAHAEDHVERFLREREAWIRRHLDRQATARRDIAARAPLGGGRSIPFLGIGHLVRFVQADRSGGRSRVRRVTSTLWPELHVELVRSDRRSPEQVLEAWLRDQARQAIDAAIGRHAGPLDASPTAITLRDPRSRWGSCSRAGRLSLSWRLVLAPPEALESVVVHELCHLRVFGHGPRFRALLGSRVPDHVRWRRWLHEHATELHEALVPSEAAEAA